MAAISIQPVFMHSPVRRSALAVLPTMTVPSLFERAMKTILGVHDGAGAWTPLWVHAPALRVPVAAPVLCAIVAVAGPASVLAARLELPVQERPAADHRRADRCEHQAVRAGVGQCAGGLARLRAAAVAATRRAAGVRATGRPRSGRVGRRRRIERR